MKLMNPGGATVTLSISAEGLIKPAISLAMARGLVPTARASLREMLEA